MLDEVQSYLRVGTEPLSSRLRYSVLRGLAAEGVASDGAAAERMQMMPRRDLVRTLQRLGLAGRAPETFIGHVLLCRSSRDLFDTPLIALDGEQVFEIRGKAFEKAMLALMLWIGVEAAPRQNPSNIWKSQLIWDWRGS